jgi:hypothetical protein
MNTLSVHSTLRPGDYFSGRPYGVVCEQVGAFLKQVSKQQAFDHNSRAPSCGQTTGLMLFSRRLLPAIRASAPWSCPTLRPSRSDRSGCMRSRPPQQTNAFKNGGRHRQGTGIVWPFGHLLHPTLQQSQEATSRLIHLQDTALTMLCLTYPIIRRMTPLI